MIMNFFNLPDHESILFMLNSSNVLIPSLEIPDGHKSKLTYFIKLESVEVTQDNYETILMSGDVSRNLIADLKEITDNVNSDSYFIYIGK